MARERRNYKTEYQRRIARGAAKGLTRAQARGHPRGVEVSPHGGVQARHYDRRLEEGFKLLRTGKSLTEASKTIRVAPERLRSYLRQQGVAEKRRGKWVPGRDDRTRVMLLYSGGRAEVVTVNRAVSSDIGRYMGVVSRFLSTNDPSSLYMFDDRGIVDATGRYHPFETDPNTLYRLAHAGTETFEQVYRIVV